MKKILSVLIVSIIISSCNSTESTKTGSDSANTSAPSVIDDTSTQHPNGVTSDGVISTDTSAFGVKANKADTPRKKH